MRKVMQAAFKKRYGFAPALKDICLLEANLPRNHHAVRLLVEVGDGHVYKLDEGTVGECRGSWK